MTAQAILKKFTTEEIQAAIDLKSAIASEKEFHAKNHDLPRSFLAEASISEIEEEINARKKDPNYNYQLENISTEDILDELEDRLLTSDPKTGRLDVNAIKSFSSQLTRIPTVARDGLSDIIETQPIIKRRPFRSSTENSFGEEALSFLGVNTKNRLSSHRTSALIDLLRRKYDSDSDSFFARYGVPAGTYFLAQDLNKEQEFDINLRYLSDVVKDGEKLFEVLQIKDPRSQSSWKPQALFTSLGEIDEVKDILLPVHKIDKPRFYQTYGSPLGVVITSKELKAKRSLDVSPTRLNTILVNPGIAQPILGIQDKDFATKWKVTYFPEELKVFDAITGQLKSAYSTDPDKFFERYGSPMGAYNLAQDLKVEKRTFKMDSIGTVIRNGDLLSRIIGIKDSRFENQWNPSKQAGSYESANQIREFLRMKYSSDQEEFFARYGGKLGIYYLMKDLEKYPGFTFKPQQTVKNLIGKGNRASEFLEIEDERFQSSWKPRSLTINASQVDQIADFMRERFNTDRDRFFARYGGIAGIVQLEKDLKSEKGIALSSGRISTLVYDPEAVKELLESNDPRFDTDWNVRSLQINNGAIDKVGKFLHESYSLEPSRFFLRYGSRAGQYLVAKDLQSQGITIPPSQLGCILNNKSLVARLTGIPEKEFEERWNCRGVGISLRQLDRVRDLLLTSYAENSDMFFERFGSADGINYLMDQFRKKGSNTPNTFLLSNFIRDSELITTLLGIEDDRFETEWNAKELSMSGRQLSPVMNFLRERYFADQDSFIERYGQKTGLYNLAIDLKKNRMLNSEHLERLHDAIAKPYVAEAIGVKDQRFIDKWCPKKINFNLNQFETLKKHLGKEFRQNSDRFFDRYGSPMRTIILSGEGNNRLNIQRTHQSFSTILSDSDFVANIINSNDPRFNTDWSHVAYVMGLSNQDSKFLDLERVIEIASDRMAESCELPRMGDNLDETEKEYLRLRYGLRTVNADTAVYAVSLYTDKIGRIKRNIDSAIDKDRKDILKLKKIKDTKDVENHGMEDFTHLVGHLLYSFDKDVRTQAGHQLLGIYSPAYHRAASKRKETPDGWELFTGYCEKFDVFSMRRLESQGSRLYFGPIGPRTHGMIRNITEGRYQNWRKVADFSLDAQFGEEGNSFHEVTG